MNLVVIPFHDWNKCIREGFRTRDAHLLEEFGKHHAIDNVLVVNRPLSPLEMLTNGLFRKNGTVRQVSGKIYTVDSVIPDFWQPIIQKRNWIPGAYGSKRTLISVKTALHTLAIDEYFVWSNSPLHAPLVRQLQPLSYAFDMTDNLLKHADYRGSPNLQEYYDYCQAHANVLTANSPDNTLWLARRRVDATYISNGVDLERFDPRLQRRTPSDLENISRPIIGFAGKMQEMIDISLLEQVVAEFSQVSFVFVGQMLDADWMQPLWRHPNVYYLGDKHYEHLPDYLAAFDICIIPYSMERQHGVDPIKFYEYLAMGKPIVTTNIGGVSRFSEFHQVCVAHSTAEFSSGLEAFVRQIFQGIQIPILPVPTDVSWSFKADQILQMLLRTVNHAQ